MFSTPISIDAKERHELGFTPDGGGQLMTQIGLAAVICEWNFLSNFSRSKFVSFSPFSWKYLRPWNHAKYNKIQFNQLRWSEIEFSLATSSYVWKTTHGTERQMLILFHRRLFHWWWSLRFGWWKNQTQSHNSTVAIRFNIVSCNSIHFAYKSTT